MYLETFYRKRYRTASDEKDRWWTEGVCYSFDYARSIEYLTAVLADFFYESSMKWLEFVCVKNL